ncbi:MAG: hypothetical protein OXC18_09590 [Desulfurellaceae bacterium]|nr:hypothetical protein [Desulfurellaceae bacterium]
MSFPQADLDVMWEKAIAGVSKIQVGHPKIDRKKESIEKSKFYLTSFIAKRTQAILLIFLICPIVQLSVKARKKLCKKCSKQKKRG